MKRFVYLVCLLALLLPACSVAEQTPTISEKNYTHGIYQLTFKTKAISNDHVGNDWSFTYTCDGKTIKNGHSFTYSLEEISLLTINIMIRENDKIDDTGTGTLRVTIYDGCSGKTQVTVTETDGRYKGNIAVWEITCQVELVGKQ